MMWIHAQRDRGVFASILRTGFVLAVAVWMRGAGRAQNSSGSPTFYRDIQPILQKHCQSCHRAGEIGPMPLMTYDQVRPLAHTVAESAGSRRMPPWFADPRVGH